MHDLRQVAGLPWPSGHGPIEAGPFFIKVLNPPALPWPSGHGPIEADSKGEDIVFTDNNFRGLRVTAPLKRWF